MPVRRKQKLIAYSAIVLACIGVFFLYMRPEFMVTLAGQTWACF
jgi:hypothetical protein